MEFVVSEKDGPHGILLIITDENILNQYFEEGKLQLDLKRKFYQGEQKSKKEVVLLIKRAQHIHFTGKAAVALAIELDLIISEKILYVQGVPHAETARGI